MSEEINPFSDGMDKAEKNLDLMRRNIDDKGC